MPTAHLSDTIRVMPPLSRSRSNGTAIALPYFYPTPGKCPGGIGTDVWCEISHSSAYFEDTEILLEGQRRLQLAVELQRPFFLVKTQQQKPQQ